MTSLSLVHLFSSKLSRCCTIRNHAEAIQIEITHNNQMLVRIYLLDWLSDDGKKPMGSTLSCIQFAWSAENHSFCNENDFQLLSLNAVRRESVAWLIKTIELHMNLNRMSLTIRANAIVYRFFFILDRVIARVGHTLTQVDHSSFHIHTCFYRSPFSYGARNRTGNVDEIKTFCFDRI